MKDWYDLCDKEIAALTEKEMKAYVQLACMDAGVVMGQTQEEPVFLDETTPEMPTRALYEITGEGAPNMGIVFAHRGDAETFRSLGVFIKTSKYLGGGYTSSVEYTQPMVPMDIQEIMLTTEESIISEVSALELAATNKRRNEELRERLDKRERDMRHAAAPLYDHWHTAKDLMRQHEEVRSCYKEYQALAKDDDAAMVCLRKAYDDDGLIMKALDLKTLEKDPVAYEEAGAVDPE